MSVTIDSVVHTMTGSMVSDPTDAFFFDHPLDHLPAMLLLDGLAGLASASPGRVAELAVEFHHFCELDQPVEVLMSSPATDGERWDAYCSSGGLVVADGHVSLRDHHDPPPPGPVEPAPSPVDRELVHRHRAENVAIGDFAGDESGCTARLLDFAPDHALRRRDPRHRSALELVEGARQLITLVGHRVWDVAPDWKYVLSGVRHEQHRAVAATEDVRFRTTTMTMRRKRVEFAVDLLAAGDVIGSVRLTGMIVPPRVYDHLRWANREAAR
ncbi:AfsA-related hotdog domain-containing protein [Saccharopolyspora sp. NPDC047091]|uniref:AfsA-related hotdog domain-containing protein n=1 Tax=Saccharopolyspora sp. NPDC047091 TaxID=3155924 RepID=UPI0033DBD37A